MDLLDIAQKALVFDSEETVNKVISGMVKNRVEEAVITENNSYKGIVFAKDLVKRKITNPEKSKIKNFIHSIHIFDSKTSVEDLLNSIVVNDYPMAPIEKNGKFFMVTKLDILGYIKNNPVFKNKKAEDVMLEPLYVSTDDTLSTAISIIRDANVSRLVVVNKKGKTEGLLSTLNLLRSYVERQKLRLGGTSGEKIKLGDVKVSSLMTKEMKTVSPETNVKEIIDIMQKNKTTTIAVEKEENLLGIVTPRMILKLASKKASKIYARVSGIQEEDPFIKSIVNKEIERTINKLERFWPISYLLVNIRKQRKAGKKRIYSVKARMITKKGIFHAETSEWDLTKAVKIVLDRIKRELIKEKERRG
jgi:CBS domain-containing protein